MGVNNLLPGHDFVNEDLKSPVLEIGQIFFQHVAQLPLVLWISASQTATFISNSLPHKSTDVNASR
jgi:hypothetical protein